MEFFRQNQVTFLDAAAAISLFMAIFVLFINFTSVKKKLALFGIQVTITTLLVSDAAAYMYRGDTSLVGQVMTRLSNFFVFEFTIAIIYIFIKYLEALYDEKGKYENVIPRRMKLCKAILLVSAILIVVSQFTGMYYYFDENNLYTRGPLYIVGYLLPLIALFCIFGIILENRRLLNKGVLRSVLIFSLFPFAASITQLFLYGLSLINFSIFLGGLVLFIIALTDQNSEYKRAASTEVMTGLLNTFGFSKSIEKIIDIKDITEYNALYFDIVRMGQINIKYGKEKGDEIICRYAAKVEKNLEHDELLGRFGGNYFVALIKKERTEGFAEFLRSVPIEIEYNGNPVTVNVNAIVGGYEIVSKNVTPEQILGNSAAAVSYAKNTVHQQFFMMDESFEKEFNRTREVEDNAQKGMLVDEFEPFYQPKVDTVTGKLCGAEALVRWRRDGKLIPPFEFIPVLEKNNIICKLDFYMLEHVCADIKEWIARGLEPVQVSVNFSRRNLGNPILSEAICKTVEKYGIPKELIQIEVTESLDEYPLSYLKGVVEALHLYGLTAAIDDFGTGSSSIMILKVIRFDELKIDKAFSDYKDEKEKQILQDIITLAKNIGLSVIAEGVESKEQVEELKSMGCTHIQGYFFDKPLEKKEFEKRLENKVYMN